MKTSDEFFREIGRIVYWEAVLNPETDEMFRGGLLASMGAPVFESPMVPVGQIYKTINPNNPGSFVVFINPDTYIEAGMKYMDSVWPDCEFIEMAI